MDIFSFYRGWKDVDRGFLCGEEETSLRYVLVRWALDFLGSRPDLSVASNKLKSLVAPRD